MICRESFRPGSCHLPTAAIRERFSAKQDLAEQVTATQRWMLKARDHVRRASRERARPSGRVGFAALKEPGGATNAAPLALNSAQSIPGPGLAPGLFTGCLRCHSLSRLQVLKRLPGQPVAKAPPGAENYAMRDAIAPANCALFLGPAFPHASQAGFCIRAVAVLCKLFG